MPLHVNLSIFLDEKGNPVELTEQAEKVFIFLTQIISAVSQSVSKQVEHKQAEHEPKHQTISVDVTCNTRADNLTCDGGIEAICHANGDIAWHCDTCQASGTVSHWQGCHWDRQARTLH